MWCYLTGSLASLSPGSLGNEQILQVDTAGDLKETSVYNGDNGIRPAMWIHLPGESEW